MPCYFKLTKNQIRLICFQLKIDILCISVVLICSRLTQCFELKTFNELSVRLFLGIAVDRAVGILVPNSLDRTYFFDHLIEQKTNKYPEQSVFEMYRI